MSRDRIIVRDEPLFTHSRTIRRLKKAQSLLAKVIEPAEVYRKQLWNRIKS